MESYICAMIYCQLWELFKPVSEAMKYAHSADQIWFIPEIRTCLPGFLSAVIFRNSRDPSQKTARKRPVIKNCAKQGDLVIRASINVPFYLSIDKYKNTHSPGQSKRKSLAELFALSPAPYQIGTSVIKNIGFISFRKQKKGSEAHLEEFPSNQPFSSLNPSAWETNFSIRIREVPLHLRVAGFWGYHVCVYIVLCGTANSLGRAN